MILYFLEFEYGKGGLNICGMNQRIYTGLKVAVIHQSLLAFKNQPELETSSQLARVFESTKMENKDLCTRLGNFPPVPYLCMNVTLRPWEKSRTKTSNFQQQRLGNLHEG
jgi:hypothetical protein